MPTARRFLAATTLALTVAACTTEPTGPTPEELAAQQMAALEQARAAEARERERQEAERKRLAEMPRFGPADMRCLALTIYWEGKSEPKEGQVAVAHVVLNRLKNPRFPRTICDVVHDGGARPLHQCQFSWWCDGRSDTPTDAAQWAEAQKIAREESKLGAADPTHGALYFHNGAVKPAWARVHTRTAQIGGHTFYR